jgi:cytochrome c oxidase assembly factor CtaG/ferredoxin
MFSMMPSLLESPLLSWTFIWLLFISFLYARGWQLLRSRGSNQWRLRHLLCFMSAILTLVVALLSPLDQLANYLFLIHMLQHLLLMMVVPPLFWMSKPLVPLLTGLPPRLRKHWAGPVLSSPPLRSFLSFIQRPTVSCLIFVSAIWIWHLPSLFDRTFVSPTLHQLEHITFVGASILFWKPIIEATRSQSGKPPWWLIPYLLFADVQNTLLSALLTFSSRPLYSHYDDMPRLMRLSVLQDQSAAGVLMWVPGSIGFLIPLAWVTLTALFVPAKSKRRSTSTPKRKPTLSSGQSLPILNRPMTGRRERKPFDLISIPILGAALGSPWGRIVVQSTALLICSVVILDGLIGPQYSPVNLAGVIPWTYGRGVIVIGLLLLGNVSCYACPLTLHRHFTENWFHPRSTWPRLLRSKWLAIVLLILFFWGYEVLAIWNSPWWTAWMIIAYFLIAFAIDSWFSDAAFCRHVCPIGQFQFVQSLISPAEIRVKNQSVCHTCQTRDCINGRDQLKGCQLGLNPPLKSGNMNCTFCLECVHACPNDNIGWLATSPFPALIEVIPSKPKNELRHRFDVSVLTALLVWLAFYNAFSMTGLAADWNQRLSGELGSSPIAGTMSFLLCAILLPWILFTIVSHFTTMADSTDSLSRRFTRYAASLVPLGASMWIAHFLFHLVMVGGAAGFTFSRFISQITGINIPYAPSDLVCHQLSDGWLLKTEILLLDVGLLASLYVLYRTASRKTANLGRDILNVLPWGLLSVILFFTGIWIILQPMQMRNTMMMGG